MEGTQNLVEFLQAELEFLNRGGYRKSSWRPQFIFEDSPNCLKYRNDGDRKPCSECVLMRLVPPERREEKIPCRFIPLNDRGDTVESLYRSATQEELEFALRTWLKQQIELLQKTDVNPAKVESTAIICTRHARGAGL